MGGGGWGGNLCLPKTFVSSLRLGSTSLATAPHTLSTPQQRLPQIHQLWKRFMLQYPRDIPIPALVLIHSLFFKQNVITWLSAWAALWGFYFFQHSCAPGFDAAVYAACPCHSLALGNVTFKCIFIFKLTSRAVQYKGPAKKYATFYL